MCQRDNSEGWSEMNRHSYAPHRLLDYSTVCEKNEPNKRWVLPSSGESYVLSETQAIFGKEESSRITGEKQNM